MSQFNNTPYSWSPGRDRLLGPEKLTANAAYDLSASNTFELDAVQCSESTFFYTPVAGAGARGIPNQAPTQPQLMTTVYSTSMDVYCDTTGVTVDSGPLTFGFYIGTTSPPSTGGTLQLAEQGVGANIQRYNFFALAPSTTYYIQSVSIGSGGEKVSAPVSFATNDGEGAAPGATFGVPVQVSSTLTSITGTITVTGLTGNPAPGVYAKISTNSGMNPLGPVSVTLVSGNNYSWTVGGLAGANDYYVKFYAANGIDPPVASAVYQFNTDGGLGPPPGPAGLIITPAEQITLNVWFDTATSSAADSFKLLYGTSSPPTTPATIVQGVGPTIRTSILTGLTAATNYYLQTVAVYNGQDSVGPITEFTTGPTSGTTAPSTDVSSVALDNATGSSITISFGSSEEGTPTPAISAAIFNGSYYGPMTVTPAPFGIYFAKAEGLVASTAYTVKVYASNGYVAAYTSATFGPYSTTAAGGPSGPPTAPAAYMIAGNEIDLVWSYAGITVPSGTLSYGVLSGTTNPPTTLNTVFNLESASATQVVWNPAGLTPSTTYYFQSLAIGEDATTKSAVVPISTSSGTGGTGPSAVVTSIVQTGNTSTSFNGTIVFSELVSTPQVLLTAQVTVASGPGTGNVGFYFCTLTSPLTYTFSATGLTPSTTFTVSINLANGITYALGSAEVSGFSTTA